MINSVDEILYNLKNIGIEINDDETEKIKKVENKYKIGISDYYFNLIDWSNKDCPIKKQCIPDYAEIIDTKNYFDDPLNEKHFSPIPFLVHKYNNKVAFMVSNSCYMYCRHCTRKNTVMSEGVVSEKQFKDILYYISKHKEIKDVLITGGDPLTLSLNKLEYYISEIRKIKSVNTIRIGTRAIVTNPDIITEKLSNMLEKYHPLWIFTQFNHYNEVTEKVKKACNILLSRGIPLGNQSVLLKGINDDEAVMEKLLLKLIGIRVRPYYLYQCDRVNGTSHFVANYKKGIEIIEELRYKLPGYAIPKFVIDAYGENGGKVTIEKNHIIEETAEYIILQGRDKNLTTKFYKK